MILHSYCLSSIIVQAFSTCLHPYRAPALFQLSCSEQHQPFAVCQVQRPTFNIRAVGFFSSLFSFLTFFAFLYFKCSVSVWVTMCMCVHSILQCGNALCCIVTLRSILHYHLSSLSVSFSLPFAMSLWLGTWYIRYDCMLWVHAGVVSTSLLLQTVSTKTRYDHHTYLVELVCCLHDVKLLVVQFMLVCR